MKFQRDMIRLYGVTDRSFVGKQTLYEQIEDALRGGVTILQLREKNLSDEQFIEEALKVKEICRSYNVPLIINDNLNVALESGADGVHVGNSDMPVDLIRKTAPKLIIGATAKNVEQARVAERAGANYLGVGALFPSPTKQNAIRITKEDLQSICQSVSIPVVAIGGITLENLPLLADGGMDGIAVVSALFGADDICSAARNLKMCAAEVVKR